MTRALEQFDSFVYQVRDKIKEGTHSVDCSHAGGAFTIIVSPNGVAVSPATSAADVVVSQDGGETLD